MTQLFERRVTLPDGRDVLFQDREDGRERVVFQHSEVEGTLYILMTTTEKVMSINSDDHLEISEDLRKESVAATYRPDDWVSVSVS